MSRDDEPRLSEEMATRLWQRAAELQADAARRLEAKARAEGEDELDDVASDEGYSLVHVRAAAEEAGKNRRSVAAGPARDESSIDRSADRSTSKPADDATFWRAAGELALWNLVAQGACNVALLFTDATRVSFLTQASIAFTPILVAITGGRVGAATIIELDGNSSQRSSPLPPVSGSEDTSSACVATNFSPQELSLWRLPEP